MSWNLTDILSVIIIFQLLFLAVFLITYHKGKRQSNILLAVFFLSICLNFTDGLLIFKNAYYNHPSFAFIGNNFSLMFGPLLFLYTQSVIYRDFKLNKGMMLHAGPFIVMLLFTILSYHTQTTDMKRYILSSARQQQYPVLIYLLSAGIYVQFFSYAFASLKKIKDYRKTILHRFSEVHRINLDWLTNTIVLFMVVIAVGIVNSLSAVSPLKNLPGFTLALIIVALFFYINRLLFKALRQPEIFKGISIGETQEATEEIAKEHLAPAMVKSAEPGIPVVPTHPKYLGSTLTAEEKTSIKQNLLIHMETHKPYLEPELNLEQLSSQLSLKPKILSQVINECLGQNFFDFVNRYRIEDAKRLLSNPADKKITVLEVLYEVGFNSKSSFNTLFKKYTGITPSEFKKQHMPL